MGVDGIISETDARPHFDQTRADTPVASLSVINEERRTPVLAEHTTQPSLTESYPSLGACATALKGDIGTMRTYVKGTKTGLYRKV